MSDVLIQNLQAIRDRMCLACEKSGRNPDDVRLLLATKTVNSEKIKQALETGENLIGENKVQELKEKGDSLKEHSPEVHFIGHLQSNKVKEVIKWVTCIESVDRISVAEKLHNRLVFEGKTMEVLIQVNTSFEDSKFGVGPEHAVELIL